MFGSLRPTEEVPGLAVTCCGLSVRERLNPSTEHPLPRTGLHPGPSFACMNLHPRESAWLPETLKGFCCVDAWASSLRPLTTHPPPRTRVTDTCRQVDSHCPAPRLPNSENVLQSLEDFVRTQILIQKIGVGTETPLSNQLLDPATTLGRGRRPPGRAHLQAPLEGLPFCASAERRQGARDLVPWGGLWDLQAAARYRVPRAGR